MRPSRSLTLLVLLFGLGCTADAGERADGPESPETVPPRGAPRAVSARPTPAPDTVSGVGATAERERLRVVVLGTSLTAGLGLLRDDDRWTARVQELADSAGLPLTIVNAGVSGETSAGGLRRLDWVLAEPVDVLVVELGANDGLRGQPPEAMAGNLREIVRRSRELHPGVRVVLAGMEAPPNLGDDYTRRFRRVFPHVAEQTGAALVPFLLEGVAARPELNQEDGIHPNAEGHRRIARNVWPVLDSVARLELDGGAAGTAGSPATSGGGG